MESIQLQASNEQTPPERLRELAKVNPAIASLVASNPNAEPELLAELADREEDFIRKNVAANPNTPKSVLWKLGEEFPTEVLENPVFPLLLLENPNLIEEIPDNTLMNFLQSSAVPISFMEWSVKYRSRKWRDTFLLLATNGKTPRTMLEKLAGFEQKTVAMAVELHVNYAGKIEQDWQKEFRGYLRSNDVFGASTLGKNPERYFLNILVTMGFVREFLLIFESLAECEQTDIREIVASIAIPLNLLEKLGRDNNPNVRAAVARNPIAPTTLQERLAKDKNWRARLGAAENPNASPELLEQLARDEVKWVREKVAENPNASPELLEQLATDGGVFLAAASNLNTTKAVLEKLASSELEQNLSLKKIFAANPNTPVRILKKLGRDRVVRDRQQETPDTPKALLYLFNLLGGEKEPVVGDRLAANPSTPKYLLKKFARSNRDERLEALASNPKISQNTIHQLAAHKNAEVRRAIAANPKTDPAVLLSLSWDESIKVRIAVALNPKAEFSLLEKSISDLFKFRKMDAKTLLRYLSEKPEGLPLLLELIVDRSSALTRTIALLHPQMRPKVLAKYRRSLVWLERCAIAANPNTPMETLQVLAADGNRIVRAAAKENLERALNT